MWTRLSISPNNIDARYRHEMALCDDKLYIIGGGTSQRSFSTEMVHVYQRRRYVSMINTPFPRHQIPVFDLITRKWSLEQSKPYIDPVTGDRLFPKPRYSHDCGQHGDDIFMVGGTNEDQVFADLWSLHLPTLTWTLHSMEALPKPLYFHSAAISDQGELYVFGGVTSLAHKIRVNTLYRTWVRVPSLHKLAREAILGALRHMIVTSESGDHTKKQRAKAMLKTGYLSVGTIESYLTSKHVCSNVFDLPVV